MERAALIAAVALWLAGCQSGPIRVAGFPGEQRIGATDLVLISLAEQDRNRLDPYFTWVGKTRHPIDSGEIWRRVFIGAGTHPLFTIEKAELRQSNEAAGFVGRWTYSIEGKLTVNGVSYPIHAEGSRAAAVNANSAMRQAVELGIVDAARKCAAIVATNN